MAIVRHVIDVRVIRRRYRQRQSIHLSFIQISRVTDLGRVHAPAVVSSHRFCSIDPDTSA